MRAAFGKVNTLHNHVLPWTDRPLVTQNLVGGEDGIDDAGLSLSRILPAPKGLFLEGTAQLFRGDSENVFRPRSAATSPTVGHLRAYRDLSESTNLDLGGSYARGHSPFAERPRISSTASMPRCAGSRCGARSITPSWRRSEFIWARTSGSSPVTYAVPERDAPPRTRQALRLLRLRRLPARAALVRWAAASTAPSAASACPPTRQRHLHLPTSRELLAQRAAAGYRRQLAADLLAERVQPDSRAAPPHPLRRGPHRQRISVPIPVLHGRAWSASVLT